MIEWESIKRLYVGDDEQFKVELQNVKDNPSEGIEEESITLKP